VENGERELAVMERKKVREGSRALAKERTLFQEKEEIEKT